MTSQKRLAREVAVGKPSLEKTEAIRKEPLHVSVINPQSTSLVFIFIESQTLCGHSRYYHSHWFMPFLCTYSLSLTPAMSCSIATESFYISVHNTASPVRWKKPFLTSLSSSHCFISLFHLPTLLTCYLNSLILHSFFQTTPFRFLSLSYWNIG